MNASAVDTVSRAGCVLVGGTWGVKAGIGKGRVTTGIGTVGCRLCVSAGGVDHRPGCALAACPHCFVQEV